MRIEYFGENVIQKISRTFRRNHRLILQTVEFARIQPAKYTRNKQQSKSGSEIRSMSSIRPVLKHEQERRGAFTGLPIGNPENYMPVRNLIL